ncbi:MAG TPA: TIGR00153 family protein [Nitrososphaeria archaeon]|nr:TIGR00153 family protein [Nitrososphaeria archaeon]
MFRGNPTIWIGRRRQREVLKLSQRHLSKINDLTKTFRKFVEAFVRGNLDDMRKLYEDIFDIEREADNEKEKIIIEVSRGPFHPIDREDIMRLVLTMDDIAANIKSASRKMLYSNPESVPTDVKNEFLKLGDMIIEIVSRLETALDALIKGSKDTLKLADSVERKEEEIDDFRVELIAKILKWGDETGKLSSLLMLKEAVENLENASDKAEDVADIIRGIIAVGL